MSANQDVNMSRMDNAGNNPEDPEDDPKKKRNFFTRISSTFKCCIGACKCCITGFKVIQKFEKAIKTILFLAGLIILIGLFWYLYEQISWLQSTFQYFRDTVGDKVNEIWDWFSGIGTSIAGVSTSFSGITSGIADNANQLWNHGLQFDFQNLQTQDDSHINCSAWISANAESDNYLIDMDGRDEGLEPFKVFCDFETNVTRISPTNIKQKTDGTKMVEYEATIEQIRLLIYHSGRCYQEIETEDSMIDHNWWLDFNGKHCNCTDFPKKIQFKLQE